MSFSTFKMPDGFTFVVRESPLSPQVTVQKSCTIKLQLGSNIAKKQIGYAAYHMQFRPGFKYFQAFRFEKCSPLMIEQYKLVTLFLEILESR